MSRPSSVKHLLRKMPEYPGKMREALQRVALCGLRGITLADGVFYQVGGLLDVQLFHNIGTVMFYGADTNIQETGNLFVGDSLGNQL